MLMIVLPSTYARLWTDTKGHKVEAEVVAVHPNRTVELKTPKGRTVTMPFDTFSDLDIEYLEELLKHPDDLHAVSWKKMNALLGMPLWNDWNLWDDPCREVATRTQLDKESETDFMENYRGYPLGKSTLFNEAVYAVALYGTKTNTTSLSLVFINQGDISPDCTRKEMEKQIEDSGKRLQTTIEQLLGEPERDSLGQDALREKVLRWNWNGHAILLSQQEGKYSAVRVMPTARANAAGRVEKISDDELKRRLASCVEKRENGDVLIRNIPMINQGPKGYCVPATWERYLRYMDMPVDMYLLALAAGTGVGGGTYVDDMTKATGNIVGSYGRKLASCGTKPDIETVARQIDQGLPILWTLMSTPAFQKEAFLNTAKRNENKAMLESFSNFEITSAGGHMCLIIGYNKQTREIAISDSWGPFFAERWVPEQSLMDVSRGPLNIVRW